MAFMTCQRISSFLEESFINDLIYYDTINNISLTVNCSNGRGMSLNTVFR
jgi:hypothetical protein